MAEVSMRYWAREDLPSTKLMTFGASSLTEIELLSLVFWIGTKNQSALEIAREMYENSNRSLCELVKGLEENADVKNIQLLAAFELGRRRAKEEEIARQNAQVIGNSRDIFAQFNEELSYLDHEELWALYLSKNGKVLCRKRISEGGTDSTGADIKKIVKPALDFKASNVCLCHNHPHSTTRPSRDDKELTQQAKEAFELFDIRLLDHIIVSDGRYYSFADNGDI